MVIFLLFFFFFNDTATTEIYTLSLHDALPISVCGARPLPTSSPVSRSSATTLVLWVLESIPSTTSRRDIADSQDRKSTRLNSSHANISYAVFCLKKHANNSYYLVIFLLKLNIS